MDSIDKNYIELNKNAWNIKTDIHVNSNFYNNEIFLESRNSLNSIELDLLGDVKGKTILHLQCHFGQDSLSLAHLGANVTGVDFSEKAIAKAKELNEELALNAEFICCDLYNLPNHLDKKFDIVFTSYGTIGWLADINKWAEVVSQFMKPGGNFVFVEFHPFIWMHDDNLEKIKYNYFNAEPIVEEIQGTYADRNAEISYQTVGWNHALSEVMQSVLNNGLQLENFQEYDYSPYNCFQGMEETENAKYRFIKFGNKLPLVYSLMFSKPLN